MCVGSMDSLTAEWMFTKPYRHDPWVPKGGKDERSKEKLGERKRK